MTEALVVLPVLLTLLFVTFQVYKMHVASINAAVLGRSEIIMEAYANNFAKSAWNPRYDKQEAGVQELGLFPGVRSVNIEPRPAPVEGSPYGVFQAFVAIATGSRRIAVEVRMPALPFTAGEGRADGVYECGYVGTSAVDSWNWDNLFERLAGWLGHNDKDVDTSTLKDNIRDDR